MSEIGWKISEITQADCNAQDISDLKKSTKMLGRNRKIAAKMLVPLTYTEKGQSPRYHFREAAKLSILSYLAETGLSFDAIEKISKVVDPELGARADPNERYNIPLRIIAQHGVYAASPKYLDVFASTENGEIIYSGGYRSGEDQAEFLTKGSLRETRTFEISNWFSKLHAELRNVKGGAD